jgi:hypothetical protein
MLFGWALNNAAVLTAASEPVWVSAEGGGRKTAWICSQHGLTKQYRLAKWMKRCCKETAQLEQAEKWAQIQRTVPGAVELAECNTHNFS